MKKRQLSIAIARFPYGGNGGCPSESPDVGDWLVRIDRVARSDDRVDGELRNIRIADTPITMSRNRAVKMAKEWGVDVLVMIDSDMKPDCEMDCDRTAKPFFETAFDFLYKHYEKGPVVLAAPYCGPPPHENIYMFDWKTEGNNNGPQDMQICQYTRNQAARMSGIQPVAAAPTGLIMYDMRIFDGMPHPYFAYEWGDETESNKGSTEDVMATRDISLIGIQRYGYNPMFATWDSWAGHVKPYVSRKPCPIAADQVSQRYAEALLNNHHDRRDKMVFVTEEGGVNGAPVHDNPMKREVLVDVQEHSIPGKHERIRKEFHEKAPYFFPKELDNEVHNAQLPDNLEALRDIVKSMGDNPVVVELGTFLGRTAKCMAEAGATVYTFDTWKGSEGEFNSNIYQAYSKDNIQQKFKDNVGDLLFTKIFSAESDSAEAGKNWKGGKVDMVFIDAGYSYEQVWEDIKAWEPHLKPGGILCGDNFGEELFPGVQEAVIEAFGSNVEKRGQSLWAWRKFDGLYHDTPRQTLIYLRELVNEVRGHGPPLVAEIGSWAGRSALVMESVGAVVHCIDTWAGDSSDELGEMAKEIGFDKVYNTFLANVGRKLGKTVFAHRMSSLEGARKMAEKGMRFDMVFIDADHTFESVRDDIAAWLPLVKPGGILCGHDYWGFEGVAQAADMSFGQGGYIVKHDLWVHYVPENSDKGRSDGALIGSWTVEPEDMQALSEMVQSLGSNPVAVEVGTLLGNTAKVMAEAGATVHTFDLYDNGDWNNGNDLYKYRTVEEVKQLIKSNLGEFADRVHLYERDSARAGKEWDGGPIDMVFIDGNHTYHGTERDIEAWRPHVRPGGIICGHDLDHPAYPGIRKAVENAFGEDFDTAGNSIWVHRVPVTEPQPA